MYLNNQVVKYYYNTDIENTITALHTGEDDRIQFEDRITGTIEDAIACL